MTRRVSVSSLALIALALPGYGKDGSPAAGGILLSTAGHVSVSGWTALPGATLLPGALIDTGSGSSARLGLGPHSFATVLADTQVLLPGAGMGDGLDLRHGSIVVREGERNGLRVRVSSASVVIRGEGRFQALCEIASAGSSSEIRVRQGWAEILVSDHAPVTLHPGEWARLNTSGMPGLPQAPGAANTAGTVTREMPRGTVERQGQQTLPLKVNDPVEWNDLVHTAGAGRLQITLTDGSVLSVGSRSEMRVIKHDTGSQQTRIELTVARMRADVQKITKPGGRFEVRTRTAVIGVVGTSFVVEADNNHTRVCVISGVTEVSSTDPNNPGTVKLHPGECDSVALGGLPGNVEPSPGELAAMINQTTVGGAEGGTGAAAAGAVAGTGPGITTIILLGAGLAVGGTVAGLAAAGTFSSGPPVSVP